MVKTNCFTWGLGKSGQLGNGKRENSELPIDIPSPVLRDCPDRLVTVAAGGLFTLALSLEGKVYAFGCGKYGRLGTNNEEDKLKPQQIFGLQNKLIKKIAAGIWHGAAVDEEGCLYLWGFGKKHGVMGSTITGVYSPPITIPSFLGKKIAGVSCGNNFTLAWCDNGTAYSWGCGRHGVLGHGDEEDKTTPCKIESLKGEHIINCNCGFAHTGAITDVGEIYIFGQNKNSLLGVGKSKSGSCCLPTKIQGLEQSTFIKVSCSVGEHHGHTLALTNQGEVYAWGDGYKGKLGLGDQTSKLIPTKIPQNYFDDEKVKSISCGGIHSTACTEDGKVYTWGCGSDGRLGHPEAKGHRYLFRSDVPRLVENLAEKGKVVSLDASYYHSVAIVELS